MVRRSNRTHRALHRLHAEYQGRLGQGRRWLGLDEGYLYLARAIIALLVADGRSARAFFTVEELEVLERAADNAAAQRDPVRMWCRLSG